MCRSAAIISFASTWSSLPVSTWERGAESLSIASLFDALVQSVAPRRPGRRRRLSLELGLDGLRRRRGNRGKSAGGSQEDILKRAARVLREAGTAGHQGPLPEVPRRRRKDPRGAQAH